MRLPGMSVKNVIVSYPIIKKKRQQKIIIVSFSYCSKSSNRLSAPKILPTALVIMLFNYTFAPRIINDDIKCLYTMHVV